MIDVKAALRYPFQQQDWLKKGFIGSLLALASFLLVPAPLLIGYVLRVMREESMPEFNNLIQMYIEGLKGLAVAILYFVPGAAIAGAFENSIGATVGIMILFVMYYSLESGFYHLANNGFRQAFSLQVLKDAFTLSYLVGLIVAGLLSFGLILAFMASLIVVIPVLLFPAVMFYSNVFRYRIMKEAIEAE